MVGISKQAHAQNQEKELIESVNQQEILHEIAKLRIKHPVMGLKKLYHKVKPLTLGRDQFIRLAKTVNLEVKKSKNYHRTTFSTKSKQYKNLLDGVSINGINQVWVSDITYFWVIDKFFYLTFIMDIYSRQVIGYYASSSLVATANVEALKMAIASRKKQDLTNLIHHSDKGTQYVFHEYIQLLESINANVSMCNIVYENTHSERLNGIIKGEYLEHRNIQNLQQLKTQLAKDVKLYNTERPHWELNKMTPVEFENHIAGIHKDKRPKMKIYVDHNTIYKQKIANQLVLF